MEVPPWHIQGRGVTQAGLDVVVVVGTCILVAVVVAAGVVLDVGVVVRVDPDVVDPAAAVQRHLKGAKPKRS